jgi:DinB superfamily/Activator of Hsp90 ATPase homolog 1-like protein
MTTVPGAIDATDAPVRKTITVKTSAARAFEVFTRGFDTWWPRSHSIGASPLKKAIIETRAGGRCYQESMDGSECDWGRVLVWDPPRRFVLAWLLNAEWQYEPDMARASEVDVRFTPESNGSTRVDLEHRHFERHGASGSIIRKGVDSPEGWGGLLELFAATAAPATAPSLTPGLAPIALMFKLNAGLLKSSVEGLGDPDLWQRPTPHNNPMLWVLGHIVSTRAKLLGLLGDPLEIGWGDLFNRGAALQDAARYPPRQEIERVHRDVAERLKAAFAAFTEADLARPATGPELPGVKTLADQLAFFAFHESYHVGQLAYIRKSLGQSGIAG